MITHIDFLILNFIKDYIHCDVMDFIMKFITAIGDHGIVYIGFAIVMLCIPKTSKTGRELAVSLIVGFVLCNLILKNAVARPRPYTLTDFEIIIAPLSDYSFPSGHTFFAFAFLKIISVRYPTMKIPALIFAILIGFSRLYLYVHFPTDVVAGAILGTLTGIGAMRLDKMIFKS